MVMILVEGMVVRVMEVVLGMVVGWLMVAMVTVEVVDVLVYIAAKCRLNHFNKTFGSSKIQQ